MKIWLKGGLIWLLISGLGTAEETLQLTNGDRITGEIIKQDEDRIFLRSSLFGDLSLPRSSIKSGSADTGAGSGDEKEKLPSLNEVAAKKMPGKKTKQNGGGSIGGKKPTATAKGAELTDKKKKSFREFMHIPKSLKGKIRLSAYHRSDGYIKEYCDISPSLSLTKGKHSFKWAFNYRYSRDDNTKDGSWDKDDDRQTVEQKYRYKLNEAYFGQSRTFWERDLVDEIDPRIIESLSLGVYLLNNDTFQLDFTGGAGYEYLRITDEVSHKLTPAFEQSFKWRINSKFSFKETFSFNGDDKEYQYDVINELEAKLNKSFSLVLKHSIDFDQEVTDGGEDRSQDTRTSAQIQLTF